LAMCICSMTVQNRFRNWASLAERTSEHLAFRLTQTPF
jgi:hypothetical protein